MTSRADPSGPGTVSDGPGTVSERKGIRTQRGWIGLTTLVLAFIPIPASAQLAPPTIRGARPIGGAPGESIALEIRGTEFEGVSSLLFDDPAVKVEGLTPGKAEGGPSPTLTARILLPADLPSRALRFRVMSPKGTSNPGLFWVGRPIPTVAEVEPNDAFSKAQVLTVPAAVEGAIQPADEVDVYAVEAQAGEALVAEVVAERAGSGLDGLVTILTPDGREVASDDDRFGHDPTAVAWIAKAGRYLVQVQDANGRDRDAKVEQGKTRPYRLTIGRLPLVTSVVPAGAGRGRSTTFHLFGVNLSEPPDFRFEGSAETPAGDALIHVPTPFGPANPWPIRVGDSPEVIEAEPNDDWESAPVVTIPSAINGTFATSGDADVFRLKAEPGREGDYIVSAYAARVGSPTDPVLTVLDDKGDPQAEDDDKLGRDARLERRIDASGGTLVSIRDAFERGGPGFVYRIEVERADGRLRVAADLGSRTLPRSGSLAVPLTIDRRGIEGELVIAAEGLPNGVVAEPISLASNAKGALLVLTATADAPIGPFPIRLVGTAAVPIVELTFREHWAAEGGPREAPIVEKDPILAVAAAAPLGIAVEPREIVLNPSGQAELKLTFDRRGDDAKKSLKVRLLAGEGGLDGIEPVNDVSVAADANTCSIPIKARADAAPRRLSLAVRAGYDGSPDFLGVVVPITLVVPAKGP